MEKSKLQPWSSTVQSSISILQQSDIDDASSCAAGCIPFSSIHLSQSEFRKKRLSYFIPDIPVNLSIVDVRKDPQGPGAFLNPYIYKIALEHAGYEWEIERRYRDMSRLHDLLVVHKAAEAFKAPMRRIGETLSSREELGLSWRRSNRSVSARNASEGPSSSQHVSNCSLSENIASGSRTENSKSNTTNESRKRVKPRLPHFPRWPESMIKEVSIVTRKAKLEKYLQDVLKYELFRAHRETAEFFEVCRYSFVENLCWKSKEGIVRKKPGGRKVWAGLLRFCMEFCAKYEKRWLIIKDTYLAYINLKTEEIEEVMLFDTYFKVDINTHDGVQYLIVTNQHRSLTISYDTLRAAEAWKEEMERALHSKSGQLFHSPNRFGSSHPLRENGYAQWFVDGRSFMDTAANMIETAREEIFIAGWWISPEVYLKRPARGTRWRLDELLKKRAENGVKIFILIYSEYSLAVPINSAYTKKILQDAHPNIKSALPLEFWSHHEKLICIDQSIAFVGGIDLCYGRWDFPDHRLTDLSPDDTAPEDEEEVPEKGPCCLRKQGSEDNKLTQSVDDNNNRRSVEDRRRKECRLWIGKDYANTIKKDFSQLHLPYRDLLDRNLTPRMPWHDIHAAVFGEAAKDISRHFIERWNFVKLEGKKEDGKYPYLLPKTYPHMSFVPFSHVSLPVRIQVLRSSSKWSVGTENTEDSIHQAYQQLITMARHFIYIENQFFISSIGTDVTNQVAAAICERILLAHSKKQTFRVYIVLPLLPGFEGKLSVGESPLKTILYWTYLTISSGPNSLLQILKNKIEDPSEYISFCGLRKFGQLRDQLVTELVYVHSKLMIVDDRYAVIGSANINDRSLLGCRDSEVAIYVEDKKSLASTMNGKKSRAGVFVSSLRKSLFREHLGIPLGLDISDPVAPHFFHHLWLHTAATNTRIYEKVFDCWPTDEVRCLEEFVDYENRDHMADEDPEKAKEMLMGVKGQLVTFPTSFLIDSNLAPAILTKEALIPDDVYT